MTRGLPESGSDHSFLERLNAEEAILENAAFRVVADAEPLTAEHCLVYSRDCVPSFADVSRETVEGLFESEAFRRRFEGYGVIERGRAPFCTSNNGRCHAHAHLFSAALIEKVRFPDLAFTQYDSFGDLLNSITPAGEYLYYGVLGGPFWLCTSVATAEKRLVRKTVARALMHP